MAPATTTVQIDMAKVAAIRAEMAALKAHLIERGCPVFAAGLAG